MRMINRQKLVFIIFSILGISYLWGENLPVEIPSNPGLNYETEEKNLIPNPGFEEGMKGWYPGRAEIDSEEFHSGNSSARISIPDGEKLDWFGGYTDKVKIEPDTKYLLSCWIQAKDIHGGRGVTVSFGYIDEEGKTISNEHLTEPIFGSFPWKKIEKVIKTEPNAHSIITGMAVMAYGSVWFDDFSFKKLKEKEGTK